MKRVARWILVMIINFVVPFTNELDYLFACQEGLCVITKHYLIVQHWRLDFHLDRDTIKRVVV